MLTSQERKRKRINTFVVALAWRRLLDLLYHTLCYMAIVVVVYANKRMELVYANCLGFFD